MLVLAPPGLRVPVEGKPKDYIADRPPEGAAGFTVPDDSAYYQRRITDGDLVVVAPSVKSKKGGE